ncbi:MAG: FprA family A-type flavoprotein [Oscillospiraceae bacterium]|nr:FprA family A-type flavoprotein [Oscillospiraceae bacterium]MDD4368824.1 FprA family A-type flavoprotein [Oscillospiraceae bacterium]
MYNIRELKPDLFWVGGVDRRLALFENMFPLPNGITYNSYLIRDEKTALLDTTDSSISRQFIENVQAALAGRTLDYLVINHMEPDHCANIDELCLRYPELKLVGNKKTFQLIRQFYELDLTGRTIEVKEWDELQLGKHSLTFGFAPMVHWPEVMFTYEQTEGWLFSADAFGSFGALAGNLFADETDFDQLYLDESRRYYCNIVGKYGVQVQNALKKFADKPIKMILPLHGPIWREKLAYFLDKYQHWSTYQPEKAGIVLVYASMYGNTENAVDLLANQLAQRGVADLRVYDLSKTQASYIIADAFKYSHLVVASPTYNSQLYYGMENLLREMVALNLRGRKTAILANGSWAPQAQRYMTELLGSMKNTELLAEPVIIHSGVKAEQRQQLEALADTLAASVKAVAL